MGETTFTKIKYDPKNQYVYFAYTRNGGEYTMKQFDRPSPEFVKAFKSLDLFVTEMCELPDEYITRVHAKSVSLNYGGPNETMGATISASMDLENSNCPLNLNTPNKPVEPYNEDKEWDEISCLSEKCTEAINELIKQAKLYLDGKRAQGDLFDSVTSQGGAA